MGTRADFYVGRGEKADWLGSIAWDGYPDGIERTIREALDEATFRRNVDAFIASREDGTKPEQGWPWPWRDSGTTDYAYALDEGKVWASCFGSPWFAATDEDTDTDELTGPGATFPNMSARSNFTMGKRSGVMVLGSGGIVDDLP